MPADPNHALWQYQRLTGIDIARDGLPWGHAIRYDNYGNAYVCASVTATAIGQGATALDWQRWNQYAQRWNQHAHKTATRERALDCIEYGLTEP
jgi:hypothetical protein